MWMLYKKGFLYSSPWYKNIERIITLLGLFIHNIIVLWQRGWSQYMESYDIWRGRRIYILILLSFSIQTNFSLKLLKKNFNSKMWNTSKFDLLLIITINTLSLIVKLCPSMFTMTCCRNLEIMLSTSC